MDCHSIKKDRRRVTSLLIKKKMQLNYAYMIAFILLIMIILFQLHNVFIFRSLGDCEISQDRMFNITFRQISSSVLYIIVAFFLSFYSSHKIAGPIYRLEKYLTEVARSDDLTGTFKLRKTDQMQELAESLNGMIGHIRNKLADAKKEREKECEKVLELAEVVQGDTMSEERSRIVEALKDISKRLSDIDNNYLKI